jgi:rare lipoprotein A
MSAWRITAGAWSVALGLWALTDGALAQTFEERWWPTPKAHAAPAIPSPTVEPVGSNAQANPQASQPDRGQLATNPPNSAPRRNVSKRSFVGKASFYAYRGGKTASGDSYRPDALTAAHRTLPFGTKVRVTDLKTSKSVEVVITDRGPAIRTRVIDLSLGAAKALEIGNRGVIQVRAEVISG